VIRYLPRSGGKKNFCIRVHKDGNHIGNIKTTDTGWYYFRPLCGRKKHKQFGTIGEVKAWVEKTL
jgi:hypothetical protein